MVNSLISLALNRFAFVDILAPLGVIACIPHFTSLAIDFFAHSTHHLIRAVQYFPVLLATHTANGATIFSATGHNTAPPAIQVAISHPVGSLHSSRAVYTGVPTHPAIAHLRAVFAIQAPCTNLLAVPRGIGAVATILAPNRLASRCFSVMSHSPALVISSHSALAQAPNFSLALRNFCANSSAHSISAPPAISGDVTYF